MPDSSGQGDTVDNNDNGNIENSKEGKDNMTALKMGDVTNIVFWIFVIATIGITLIVEAIKDKKKKQLL